MCESDSSALRELDNLCAEPKAELGTQEVVSQFLDYYWQLPIKSSVNSTIKARIDSLKTVSITLSMTEQELVQLKNQYILDDSLTVLCKLIAIAKLQDDPQSAQRLSELAAIAAEHSKILTSNDYWLQQIQYLNSLTLEESMCWLTAHYALKFCDKYHATDSTKYLANQFGAVALCQLLKIHDARLEADIMQRVIYINYYFDNLYNLAMRLLEYYTEMVQSISYDAKYLALKYHLSFVMSYIGYNKQSKQHYDELMDYIDKNPNVPDLEKYKPRIVLAKMGVAWDSGQFELMQKLIHSIEFEKLIDSQKIDYLIYSGFLHLQAGEFPESNSDFKKAVILAQKESERRGEIHALLNLGNLQYQLTEYDSANVIFDSVELKLSEESNANAYRQLFFELYINRAEVYTATGKYKKARSCINSAKKYIGKQVPTENATNLLTIADLFISISEYDSAIDLLEQVIEIDRDFGLDKYRSETLIDLADIYLINQEYDIAKNVLDSANVLASQLNDELFNLNILALMGEFEYCMGRLDTAIYHLNFYAKKLDALNIKLSNYDKLRGLNQRTFDNLQRAVFYEIQNGRIDSALVKLESAKARALFSRLNAENTEEGKLPRFNLKELRQTMEPNELILSYFVSRDTLFTFAISSDVEKVFRKEIEKQTVTLLTLEYLANIQKTIKEIGTISSKELNRQYSKTVRSGKALSAVLFDNPELVDLIDTAEITYIIPDDILYSLPFACLPMMNDDTEKYLVHETAIVNLPSCTFYQMHSQSQTKCPIDQKRILYSIAPEFPGAGELTEFVQQNFSNKVELVVDDTTKSELLEKLGDYEIYILFGHCVPNPKFPDASFIELNVKNTLNFKYYPMTVSMADLRTVNWKTAERVYLVGCETGEGKFYKGSGLASIRGGLLSLGVQEIIASYWKVDSKYAVEQLKRFIQEQQEVSSAKALQLAQIEMIGSLQNDPIFMHPHPSLWGCFSLIQAFKSNRRTN